ncbi:MAG TPA: kelch repeat-containing protein, partial [Thermoplasmata archaeon]
MSARGAGFISSASNATSAGNWSLYQSTPAFAPNWPPPRRDLQLAYDGRDGYVLLFGGAGPQIANDTWTYRAGNWTELHPPVAPDPRGGGGMVFDPTLDAVLLFGGQSDTTFNVLNDTWTFAGGNWTELHPSVAPLARQFLGMTYDAADGYVVLFGGNDNQGTTFSDTWSFQSGNWTNLSGRIVGGVGPSARTCELAYDARDAYVVMFSGGHGISADTWTYQALRWTNLSIPASASPPPRWPGSLAYISSAGAVVLFGGIPSTINGEYFAQDTWTFVGGNWTQLHPASPPTPRWIAGFADDPADGIGLLFGGGGPDGPLGVGANLDDAFAFLNGSWQTISAPAWRLSGHPPTRAGPAMSYDPAAQAVVLFGGDGNFGMMNDTWLFQNGNWTALATASAPSPRAYAGMAFDPSDGWMILFG